MKTIARLILVLALFAPGLVHAAEEISLPQSDGSHEKLGGTGDSLHAIITALQELLACEDITNDVCRVEERYSNIPVGGSTAMVSADQLYKSGVGYVRGIDCYGTDNAATAGTISLLDSAAAGSGNVLWSRTILAADYSIAGFKADLQTTFAVGLYLDFTTTTDVACIVRYR